MNSILRLIVLITLAVSVSGCVTGALNATKTQQSSEKAMVIIDIPSSTDLASVKKGLREAIAYRSKSFRENTNFLPSELPANPLEPNFNGKTIFSGGLMNMAAGNPSIEMMKTDVTNSYYYLSGTEDLGNYFARKSMAYVGALYPAKDISRVYLVVYFQEGTSGIQGALTKAMADSIIGGKGAIPFMLQVKEKFLDNVPAGKVVKVQPIELNDVMLTRFNTVTTAK
jgi:hypothetical protein